MKFEIIDITPYLCEKNIRLISSLFNPHDVVIIAEQVALAMHDLPVEEGSISKEEALKNRFRLSFLYLAELYLKTGFVTSDMTPKISRTQSKAWMAELDRAFINDSKGYRQAKSVVAIVHRDYYGL